MFSLEETSLAQVLVRRLRADLTKQQPRVIELPKDERTSIEKYCPHKPWPKQELFLSLDCEEAFFGGAAGGGKSDVLLMAALQHVHVPNYHALIIRKSYKLLSKAGAIMGRAREWLYHTDAKWNHETKSFRFPSGASLEFGYLDNPTHWMNYLGTDYQFIGWDELTEIQLADEDENNPYLCMFRSLRQTADMNIPLRVRAASNPGGVGHGWVKKRFITEEASVGLRRGEDRVFEAGEGRKFVPSLAKDNPSLKLEEYLKSLAHLPEVTRLRQMNGDWDVAASLQIPEEWFRYYTMQGQMLCPRDGEDKSLPPIDERNCNRFATIDSAGTDADKAAESKGKPPSFSAMGIWDFDRTGKRLFLRHMWRERVGWTDLRHDVPLILKEWDCKKVFIENAHFGTPLSDEVKRAGISNVQLIGPVIPGMNEQSAKAKLARAAASGLLAMLQAGQVFLPVEAKWLDPFERELTAWTGKPDETADQIDVSSYAAWHCKQTTSSTGGPVSVLRRGI